MKTYAEKMNFNRIALLILFLKFGIIITVIAGEKDSLNRITGSHPATFLCFAPNAGNFFIRDEGTSPLIYSGFLYGAQLGTMISGKKHICRVDFTFLYGKLNTRNYPEDPNRATAYCNTVDANIAWCVYSGKKRNTKLFVGPDLNAIGNFRANPKFDNASFNYEVISSVGPIIYLQNTFTLNFLFHSLNPERKLTLLSSVFIPALSGFIRPAYSVIEDFPDITKQAFNEKNVSYRVIPQYSGMTFRSQLICPLPGKNCFRFGYEWYFYSLHPGQNNLKGVNSNFSIAFLFRLTHN